MRELICQACYKVFGDNYPDECGHVKVEKLLEKQPDLAGIREVYEKYEHLDALLSDPYWDDDIRGHIRYELWQAVKGICKEGP